MDREEAQNRKVIDYFDGDRAYTNAMGVGMVKKLIDRIYDDFESRTCENCKHVVMEYKEEYGEEILECKDMTSIGWWKDGGMALSDGCNKFERKNNE